MPDFFDDESDADERKTKVEDLELIVKLAEAEASEKAAEARTLEAKAKIRDAEARLSEAEARIAEAGAKQYAADADRKTQIAAAHIATRGTMWAATIKAIAVIAVALIALFPVQTTGPYTPLIVGAFQSMNSGSSVPGVPTHTPLPSSAPSTTNQPTSVPTATITPHVQATVTQSPTPIPTNTIVPPQAIAPAELIQSLEVLTNRVPGATFTVSRSGRYTLKYVSGAYCTYRFDPGQPDCLPTVWLVPQGVSLWEQDGRTLNENVARAFVARDWDGACSDRIGYCETVDDAEAFGKDSPDVNVDLAAGTTWILIAVDHREAYGDNGDHNGNPTSVLVDLYYEGQ